MLNENENLSFLREKLEAEIMLPESLSKENIVNLVSGEKPNKRRNGLIRRFIAVGIAACLMITCVSFLWDRGFFSSPVSVPEETVVQGEASVNTADGYDELLAFIKDYAKEYKEQIFYTYTYSGVDDFIVDEKAEYLQPDASVALPSYNTNMNGDTSDAARENEYGEINLREYGVKEADIFITDGNFLYCLDNYGMRLRIIKANADGTLESVYEGDRKYMSSNGNGESVHYSGLYIYDNYLIVSFTRYDFEKYKSKSGLAGVMIYDVADKSAPKLLKEISLDGNYVSSRIIDSSLVLITRYSITANYETTDDSLLLPFVYNGDVKYSVPCASIVYSSDDKPEAYVNIAKIDLADLENEPAVSSYLGTVSDTYCTKDTLYIIGNEFRYGDGVVSGTRLMGGVMISMDSICTTITKADISGDGVDIKCRTEFKGSLLNSYSIDEYKDFLRVAVTTADNENCIYVFDENLGKVGEITGLAKGEQIKSARFMGDTAYIVTFVQTDPLFVIDLTDPEKPVVKGEVKLPGFSSYLHPAGDGLLVGVGVGGTENGTDGSSKISLFDVTDPTSPKEIDSLVFPTSQLGAEAKAFCSISENAFLVPYVNWTNEDYSIDNYFKFYTGALEISVKDKKLALDNAYILMGGESVSRATFIGDRAYVFSEGESGVAAFSRKTGEMLHVLSVEDVRYSFEASKRPINEILY